MAAPEGYTPLAIVGYTDKGTYNAGTTYNKYNVVLYDGSSYVAIKDGVTGVTPSNDGVNWRTFANGFPSNGVTTDNFQSTLGNYLANNGTTTNSGFALDARYGKTLQDSVDALNRKIIPTEILYQEEYKRDCLLVNANGNIINQLQFLCSESGKVDISFNSKQAPETWNGLLENLRLIVEERSYHVGDIESNQFFFPQMDISKAGYIPVGVLGETTSGGVNWTSCVIFDCKLDGSSLWSRGYNFATEKAVDVTAKFKILYQSDKAIPG